MAKLDCAGRNFCRGELLCELNRRYVNNWLDEAWKRRLRKIRVREQCKGWDRRETQRLFSQFDRGMAHC